jgi:hypothetical protein
MNIFEKMSEATTRINTVAKNLSVQAGKTSYKAVGEADVLAAVKPIEAELGIYSYPYSRRVIESGEIVNQSTYNGQTTERKQLFLRLETVYRFVNTEKPSEYIDIATYGDGVDTQDKAPGKAMTYSDKYALLKAYKIQTGDDPDQTGSEPLVKRAVKENKPSAAEIEALKALIDRMNATRKAAGGATFTPEGVLTGLLRDKAPKSLEALTMAQYAYMVQGINSDIATNEKKITVREMMGGTNE